MQGQLHPHRMERLHHTRYRGSLIFGVLLVALGIVFFAEQFLGIGLVGALWPLLIIGVGLLFFAGMVTGGKEAGGLAIPGSMFVMLGLVFLYQNTFDHWESWSYAWTLVAPTAVGVGLVIFGWWSDQLNLRRAGVIVTGIGLLLFIISGAFFELIFNLTGDGTPGRYLFPLVLVALGLLLVFRVNLFEALSSLVGAGAETARAQQVTPPESDLTTISGEYETVPTGEPQMDAPVPGTDEPQESASEYR